MVRRSDEAIAALSENNGRLTDHHGKTVDFRNVILIMTTNAGASDMAKEGIGFGDVNFGLLDRFARIGLGRVVRIKAPK